MDFKITNINFNKPSAPLHINMLLDSLGLEPTGTIQGDIIAIQQAKANQRAVKLKRNQS